MKNVFISLLSMIILNTGLLAAGNGYPVRAEIFKNVAYGKYPAQKMDVYLPQGRTTSSTPALILLHGGGWISGDKADFQAYVDSFRRRFPNYAIFNVNYRLATLSYTNLYPTQEEDVKAAMAFIYNKRNEYHISDQYILLGASAGGNLALLQAYKQSQPVRARAVINFFGPADMKALYHSADLHMRSALQIFMGGSPVSNATNYTNASPIHFISAQTPPTLILYGGADRLVPPAQNKLLQTKLEQARVAHKVVYYPTLGHGWYGEKLTDSFNQIAAFLKSYVN
jgi:acetyl esterase/lipase